MNVLVFFFHFKVNKFFLKEEITSSANETKLNFQARLLHDFLSPRGLCTCGINTSEAKVKISMSRREKKFCSSNNFEWLTMKKIISLKKRRTGHIFFRRFTTAIFLSWQWVGILDISYFNEREALNEFVKKDYLIRDYLFKAKCIFKKIEKNYW